MTTSNGSGVPNRRVSNDMHGASASTNCSEERQTDSIDLDATESIDLEEGVSAESLIGIRSLRSKVWRDFKPEVLDGPNKAICKHCGVDLVAGNKYGTSHLKYHAEISCPQLQVSKKRKSGTPKSDIPIFDQQQSRDDFARMITCHSYAFMMCEHYYTRRFVNNLQPLFNLGHRTSVREDCLDLHKAEKAKLYDIFLAHSGRVSITSDLWTSNNMIGYMSMTAHYIDLNWKLHKKIIGFVHVKSPHTGEHVAAEIISRLYDWNLDRKTCCFVLDNCSVNDVVVRETLKVLVAKNALLLKGELFHIRCAAHVLNLIVQDGLKVILPVLVNVRETVKCVKASTGRKEKFQIFAKQVNAPDISLVSDVPTRWNSTYDMLQTAIKFRDAFVRMKERDTSYQFCPSNEDWSHLATLMDCLKVFKEVTLRTSGTKFLTASLYFNDFGGIYLRLLEWEVSKNEFVAKMAVPMKKKFEKYWNVANKLLSVATILDPRYKLKSIEYFYGLLNSGFEAEIKVESVKKCFQDLFDEYASQVTQNSSLGSTSRSMEVESGSTVSSLSLFATRLGLAKFIQDSNSSQHQRSELEVYLDDPSHPESDSFDILAWWALHGPKYPIISRMARDILSVPISTVASESAFSSAGRVLDDYRSSLIPETVEALMCTQDWLRDYIPADYKKTTRGGLDNEASSPIANEEDLCMQAEPGSARACTGV